MRVSNFFLSTLKEAPSEAELVSHRLMLRAGLVRRLGSGIYSLMPMGLRIARKVEAVVREEMNRAGAVEMSMPVVQPAELWQESGRWQAYGPELLRLKDRHERDFVIQPTSEEVVTDIARNEIKSYRQLPVHFYQIQTKFRDERRPRFGVMRGREFVMKDGYSFHAGYADLEREYQNMYDTYTRIFTRLGLKFRAVAADTGSIGGTGSHEFHVLADSGEDAIAFCPQSDYAANIELAEGMATPAARGAPGAALATVATPGVRTIDDLCRLLGIPAQKTVKTLVYQGTAGLVALILRGDHMLNEIKAAKLPALLSPLQPAAEADVRAVFGAGFGSLGPLQVKNPSQLTIIVDRSAATASDFAAGIEVLLDDRDERPGVMFADMELIGIPHRIVIGDRGLKQGQFEYQGRRDKAAQPIAVDNAADTIKKLVCGG